MSAGLDRRWRFQSRKSGFEKVTTLWLYPELDYSTCVDDADDQSGAGQLAFYLDNLRRARPEYWEADAVPIYWFVRGDPGITEQAPNNADERSLDKHFLTSFTPPVDAATGEPLNWWRLPVRNDRSPEFAKALGWLPSPFQEFAPLRSIVTNATVETRRRR